jgi:hypothetical protein
VPVRWRHLTPLVFVAALVTSICGAAAGWLPWWPALAVTGPYAVATVIVSVTVAARERSIPLAVLLPLIFASLHISYGTGSLWGVLRLASAWSRRLWPKPFKERTGSPGPARKEVSP